MSSVTIDVGALIFDMLIRFEKVTEYGASFEAVFNGQVPPEGARFDVLFSGIDRGPKLGGSIAGVDYLYVRADGRIQMHVHAELTAANGAKISYLAEGVSTPAQGGLIHQLRESVILASSFPTYAWVNRVPVWAPGTVDLAKREVVSKGYVA